MDPLNEQILGKGITFPFQLDNSGKIVINHGVDLIENSIRNILRWDYGSRYFLKEYGSKLYNLIHEPNDAVLMAVFRQYVVDAITTWEKRIVLKDIRITRTDAYSLHVELVYAIINTMQEKSFIFPFYTNIIY